MSRRRGTVESRSDDLFLLAFVLCYRGSLGLLNTLAITYVNVSSTQCFRRDTLDQGRPPPFSSGYLRWRFRRPGTNRLFLPSSSSYSHQDPFLSRIFQSTFSPHIVIIWVRPNWIKVGYAAPERPSPHRTNVISLIFRLNRSAQQLFHIISMWSNYSIIHFPSFFFFFYLNNNQLYLLSEFRYDALGQFHLKPIRYGLSLIAYEIVSVLKCL